jgi:DNA-binding NarL/FixJ family response regulator
MMPSFLAGLRKILKKKNGSTARRYSAEEHLVLTLRETAERQGRSAEDVLDDVVRLRDETYQRERYFAERWDSLTSREQEVTALVCLGYKRNQIANILGITSETVKSHLESIFRKFRIYNTRHLSEFLKDRNFAEWWRSRHP